MLSNDILQIVLFLEQLPKSVNEKIIIIMQLICIVSEIVAFFYIKNIKYY